MKKEEQEQKPVYGGYCRKSSEDGDRQANSIEDQERELEHVEMKEKLNVKIKFPGESQSAFTPGRPIFADLIKGIETGKINSILTWHINRLARNPIDAGQIIYLMDIGKLKEIKTPSKTYYNTAGDKFILHLELSISKKDSDEKSVAVKRALTGRALRGLPGGVSKIGFLNDKTEEKGNRKWIIDKVRMPLVKKMFQQMLTGQFSPAQLYRYAKDDLHLTTIQRKKFGGRPIAYSYMYSLLRDSTYAGFFFQGGIRYELDKRLPRIITEAEYWKIQTMLGLKGRPQPSKHEGLYNPFMTCGQCNGHMCPDFKFQMICPDCKKKFAYKNTDECPKCKIKISQMVKPTYCTYVYYFCINNKKHRSTCNHSTVEEMNVTKYIQEKISTELSISKELSDWCLKHLYLLKDKEIEEEAEVGAILDEQETQIKKKLSNLLSYRINRTDTSPEQVEIFDAQEKALQEEWSSIKQRRVHKIDWYSQAVKEFNLLTEVEDIIKNGTPDEKKDILKELRSNLTVSDKRVIVSNKKSIDTFGKLILGARLENKAFEPKSFHFDIANKGQKEKAGLENPTFVHLLDVVREVITFWKTNKEHIYIPNYRDGLFKITQPTEVEMASYSCLR